MTFLIVTIGMPPFLQQRINYLVQLSGMLRLRNSVLTQLIKNLNTEPVQFQYVKSKNITIRLTLNTFVVVPPTLTLLLWLFCYNLSTTVPDGHSSVALTAEFNFMPLYNKGMLSNR